MSLTVDIEKRLGAFHLRAAFESRDGVLGLLGASGCGKSVTLRCIAGVERPDRGRITLNGRVLFDSRLHINLPPQRRGVGCLFQSGGLFPNMTVRQNLLCGLRRQRDRAAREAALDEVRALLRLEGLDELRPCQLSGGQAQRTALGRILLSRPELLMLDEPFSALDSHLREKLTLEFKELLEHRFGGEVLLVTHSRDEAYRLCSQVAVMNAGQVLSVRDTKALFADPGSVCAAELTGCKNITRARRAGRFVLEVPAWKVRLVTDRAVGDGVTAVGVRARHFGPEIAENRNPVIFAGGMEEPFERILAFRFPGQAADSPAVWWREAGNRGGAGEALPGELGVAPEHVLPLCD